MDANAIYADIKQSLGQVPGFLKLIPKDELEREWMLFKRIELDENVIPNKYRELIGVGVAAATRCRYCTLFHTEVAKLFGATDAEVEFAVRYAKNSAGWSTYLNGLQVDYGAFKKEVAEIRAYVQSQMSTRGGAGSSKSAPTHVQ